ncbi:L,D-transpeptidase [bacterium]|nr:L,D-transpeptidase [bacterium]
MRAVIILFWIIASAAPGFGQKVVLTGPNRQAMIEGRTYSISWHANGLESISVIAYGTRTPLGETYRGDFDIVIADNVPANESRVDWRLPWIDSIGMIIRVEGYDGSGEITAADERKYAFRPAVMAYRFADGIYLDLHDRTNQRLYVQKNQRITHAYISSSSRNYLWLPPSRHLNIPHDHAGVFRVLAKIPNYWSRLFDVPMPHAMRYLGGHFIHATSPDMYEYLGGPASSGCNRLTEYNARELYAMAPIGTRVEVIGPGG